MFDTSISWDTVNSSFTNLKLKNILIETYNFNHEKEYQFPKIQLTL